MVEHRFDYFAEGLAQAKVDRRHGLGMVAGLFGATLSGATYSQQASPAAKPPNPGPGTGPSKQCQDFCKNVLTQQRTQCLTTCQQCNNSPAKLCGSPRAYTCCSSGTCCSGTCTDTQHDPNHCGTCSAACTNGSCVNGACVPTCPAGQTICTSVCTDLNSDANNCGACGITCNTNGGEQCISGHCGCAPGLTACSGTCVNLQSDVQNCGNCGHACTGDSQMCFSGVCAIPTGNVFVCPCSDGTVVEACVAMACSPTDATTCQSMCASHGGLNSGGGIYYCDGTPCLA